MPEEGAISTTKVTLRRECGPGAGPATFRVLDRHTKQYLGLVHFYPGNAALNMDAGWIALYGAGIQEFPPEAFRVAVAYAAGWGQPAAPHDRATEGTG